MRVRIVLAVAVVALAVGPAPALHAQDRPWTLPDDPTVLDGWLAWDRGEYPTALEHYLEALGTDASAARVRELAALTGEVYTTTEIAPDGGQLAVSSDGRHMSFVVDAGDGPTTRVVDVATGAVVASFPGASSALGPDGQVAYLAAGGPEYDAARAAMGAASSREERMEALSRAALATARSELRLARIGGDERAVAVPGLVVDLAWAPDRLLVLAMTEDGRSFVWDARDGAEIPHDFAGYPRAVRTAGRAVIVDVDTRPALPLADLRPGGSRGAVLGLAAPDGRVVLEDFLEGTDFSAAHDGSVVAYVAEGPDGAPRLRIRERRNGGVEAELTPTQAMGPPAVSPDGRWVAFPMIDIHDWEIWAVPVGAPDGEVLRITDHIHHDRQPMWVGDRILAVRGEGRHQRSYVYPVEERAEPLKLFHNNTVRTIAPEYEWAATPDGTSIFVVAERDGDTVSPERAVHRIDLNRPVTADELEARLRAQLAAETSLRERGEASFHLDAERIRVATEGIATERIYAYADDLFRFGSKNVRAEGGGNRKAIEYLVETLEGWGYAPVLDWWEVSPGVETTNVVVRIPGTQDPDLVYVVSSHFDSSTRGPGADDNTSGTTALLEVARLLADRPQEATIELAFFTGEESGLLGSRRYVAQAQASGKRIVGALNNDMVGWAGDHRLDNTIRYSNPGIRDIQHAAAMQFSKLITYDALYYKSTDAAAYYEAYGDIVGGIGSYPVLSNPHYHQYTDRIETVNHELVGEVARTTAATIMLLASAPSRVNDLMAGSLGEELELTWSASPESDVVAYEVAWTAPDGERRTMSVDAAPGLGGSVRIPSPRAGSTVEVTAVDAEGHRGWDAARWRVGR